MFGGGEGVAEGKTNLRPFVSEKLKRLKTFDEDRELVVHLLTSISLQSSPSVNFVQGFQSNTKRTPGGYIVAMSLKLKGQMHLHGRLISNCKITKKQHATHYQ